MSYILDALKKSDRERQRDNKLNPALVPQAEYRVRRHEAPAGAWSLMVLALVLASAVGGAMLAWYWRAEHAPAQAAEAPAEQTAIVAAPVTEAAATSLPAAVPEAATPVEAPAVIPLLEIWQLTEAEQRYLQELVVSLHIYSLEPAQRTVIVNGLRVREGQPLGQDLRLLEITSDGMILEFQGQHVHLATVQGP